MKELREQHNDFVKKARLDEETLDISFDIGYDENVEGFINNLIFDRAFCRFYEKENDLSSYQDAIISLEENEIFGNTINQRFSVKTIKGKVILEREEWRGGKINLSDYEAYSVQIEESSSVKKMIDDVL